MWMAVFVWCLFSSAVIYSAAAVLAFAALRKHSLGRFYSVMILVMGLIIPLSLGLLSSGAIAFVYKHSNFNMVSPATATFRVFNLLYYKLYYKLNLNRCQS